MLYRNAREKNGEGDRDGDGGHSGVPVEPGEERPTGGEPDR